MRRLSIAIASIVALAVLVPSVKAGVRVKDLADVQGAPSKQLVGISLVVKLAGTGGRSTSTRQMAEDALQLLKSNPKILGDIPRDAVFKTPNISMVMVTADLGPFHRRGGRVAVTVLAIDDATSLANGVLLRTALHGSDGSAYVIASGPISTGKMNDLTVGNIQDGGEVVGEVGGEILSQGQVRLKLRNPDDSAVKAIARGINERYGPISVAIDAGMVQVTVPIQELPNLAAFVAQIGEIEVAPESPARIVICEGPVAVVAGRNCGVRSRPGPIARWVGRLIRCD